MTIKKFANQAIPKEGFTHNFKQSGKIACILKTGGVKVKTFNKNVELSFSQGFAVGVEDNKPETDTTTWTVTIKREPADQDATVDLEAPLN